MVMLVLGLEFVVQHLAVVADHPAGDSAVVVLVLKDATAARIEPLVADQAVVVLILEVLAIHEAATRGLLVLEGRSCYAHGQPPFTDRRAGIRPTRERTGICREGRGARRAPSCDWYGGNLQPGLGGVAPHGRKKGPGCPGWKRQGQSHNHPVSSPTRADVARE